MRSPLPATVLIACPHCGTRYQVPMETIGPEGREVLCAHCSKSWQAEAGGPTDRRTPAEVDADRLFDAAAEDELDAAFAAEADAVVAATPGEAGGEAADADDTDGPSMIELAASIAPKPEANAPRVDPALKRKRKKAFNKRQDSIARKLPLARVRRSVRLVTLGLLASLMVGGVVFRAEIVRALPDLAGAYEALGLGVNIVGLEFRDVTTLLALRNEATVMRVDARIYSVAKRNLAVPPVVVSLLDANGVSLYEWSVTPDTQDLEPGEAVDFSTQLNAPPAAATQVRLSFANGRAPATTTIQTETR